eukprot:1372448-Amorphochlora_amoeboformis.AAC.1
MSATTQLLDWSYRQHTGLLLRLCSKTVGSRRSLRIKFIDTGKLGKSRMYYESNYLAMSGRLALVRDQSHTAADH